MQFQQEQYYVTIWQWPCGTWTDERRDFLEMLEYKSDDYEVISMTLDEYKEFTYAQ